MQPEVTVTRHLSVSTFLSAPLFHSFPVVPCDTVVCVCGIQASVLSRSVVGLGRELAELVLERGGGGREVRHCAQAQQERPRGRERGGRRQTWSAGSRRSSRSRGRSPWCQSQTWTSTPRALQLQASNQLCQEGSCWASGWGRKSVKRGQDGGGAGRKQCQQVPGAASEVSVECDELFVPVSLVYRFVPTRNEGHCSALPSLRAPEQARASELLVAREIKSS
eukprot:2847542-Rhodomonas_salina.1